MLSATQCDVWWLIGLSLSEALSNCVQEDSLLQTMMGDPNYSLTTVNKGVPVLCVSAHATGGKKINGENVCYFKQAINNLNACTYH